MITHQFEVENAALRETSKQQEAQIVELQKQVQGKVLLSPKSRMLSLFMYMQFDE